MESVPAGGPSTVNGILYQLLYSLLTLGSYRVVGQQLDEGRIEQVTLILEPSGGGDQQAFYTGTRVVTQLKAKSTGGTWSLQDIMSGVLPDLYRAIDPTYPNSEYRFVTEGERGQWTEAAEFFHDLSPTLPPGNCLDSLDDTKAIRFRRHIADDPSKSFWEDGPYTQRRMFQKVVDTVRMRREVAAEPYEETCKKTWTLLRGFRFMGGVSHDALRTNLDRWLLAQIGSADRLSEKRDHFLLELGRLACSGNARIESGAFFNSLGIADVSLTKWALLSQKGHEYLTGVLWRKRFQLSEDVRQDLTDDILVNWTMRKPLLVLTGESGTGKTWHGYKVLFKAAAGGDVAILVDSRGDSDHDLIEAANTFWHSIVGVDESIPLSRLRARLQQIDPANLSRQVTILIDNVSSQTEVRRLLEQDWESLGVRVAITCAPHIAVAIQPLLENRGRKVTISDYTLPELQMFLFRVVGIAWEEVPFDVQKVIRRPLMAELFGRLVAERGWKPRNEYELCEKVWEFLSARGVNAFDIDGLRRAALRLLSEGARYPWAVSDLRECDLNSEAVDRLVRSGWLRETTGGDFEVWHDRLLNWNVAEGLAYKLLREPAGVETRFQSIVKLFREPWVSSGRMLAYVPLDVMWLLSGRADNDLFERLLSTCDTELDWAIKDNLYKDLLPTLGDRAVPFLLHRLRIAAVSGASFLINAVIAGLVSTGDDDNLREHAMELLGASDPKVRRAGVRLISKLPVARALDDLWGIHVDCVQNSSPYLWDGCYKSDPYQDTFNALKECVRLNLPWLAKTIQDANREAPVYDLAYLLSAVGDQNMWQNSKHALFAKVDAAHERAIASCILEFRDHDTIEWLECRVARADDLLGAVAFRALTAIEPQRALALLDRMDEGHLSMTRNWCFAALHLQLPNEVMAHFAGILKRHEHPFRYALILQGRENLIDAISFDFLLDRFTEVLTKLLASERPVEVTGEFRLALRLFNSISRPELLNLLMRRRGSLLEQKLTEFAIALGPQETEWKETDKCDALDALARIGGDGFNQVLVLWLEKAGWGGQIHAVQFAQRRASPRTIEILTTISELDAPADQKKTILCAYATAALATHHCWRPVLRYYLRVGLKSLNVVVECFPRLDRPLDDVILDEALADFRSAHGPSAGSVLCIGIAQRRELLPDIRGVLHREKPGSELAGACLVALQWLCDTEPDMIPAASRHLATRTHLATNALLANGHPLAVAELIKELQRRPELQLAVNLANHPQYRDAGIAAIQRLAFGNSQTRFDSWLTTLVALANTEVLAAIAEIPQVFVFAEEIAYSSYHGVRVIGEKPSALRIVAMKQPEAAQRMALARVRHPNTPDPDLYVPLITKLAGERAVQTLLNEALQNPVGRAIRAIGLEVGRLNAKEIVGQWLRSDQAEKQLAGCRIAKYLPYTDELIKLISVLGTSADKKLSDAAIDAHDGLMKNQSIDELVHALSIETDQNHRWVLLETIASIAHPETASVWLREIGPKLTSAQDRHILKKLKDRRETIEKELDRDNRC